MGNRLTTAEEIRRWLIANVTLPDELVPAFMRPSDLLALVLYPEESAADREDDYDAGYRDGIAAAKRAIDSRFDRFPGNGGLSHPIPPGRNDGGQAGTGEQGPGHIQFHTAGVAHRSNEARRFA